ncbi:hypothetical protein NDU88_001535 [Pleurodeles waltl]|uniref:Uncharacterized protein n=1 Tax=Pleurodeles waltl TaxID=8319 RepID=A0AAV7T0J6_PLEWA|nr:hypothetical protein NDU88_001535 [Pleurodeles waltl]
MMRPSVNFYTVISDGNFTSKSVNNNNTVEDNHTAEYHITVNNDHTLDDQTIDNNLSDDAHSFDDDCHIIDGEITVNEDTAVDNSLNSGFRKIFFFTIKVSSLLPAQTVESDQVEEASDYDSMTADSPTHLVVTYVPDFAREMEDDQSYTNVFLSKSISLKLLKLI